MSIVPRLFSAPSVKVLPVSMFKRADGLIRESASTVAVISRLTVERPGIVRAYVVSAVFCGSALGFQLAGLLQFPVPPFHCSPIWSALSGNANRLHASHSLSTRLRIGIMASILYPSKVQ